MVKIAIAILFLSGSAWAEPWVAEWKYIGTEPTTCECAKPKMNPYSGEIEFSQTICAAACSKMVSRSMSKEFSSKEEAEMFKANCPSGPILFGNSEGCTDWKIYQLKTCQEKGCYEN